MIYIKTEQEFKDIINNEKVLVDFYADWCGPCQMLGQVLEGIEKEIDIKIVKVNTDSFFNIAREYKIMSIPAIKIFDRGKIVKEKVGFLTKDELKDFIKD